MEYTLRSTGPIFGKNCPRCYGDSNKDDLGHTLEVFTVYLGEQILK